MRKPLALFAVCAVVLACDTRSASSVTAAPFSAELGTYTVQLLPRIDGRGPLTDLGVFAVVTVAKNP